MPTDDQYKSPRVRPGNPYVNSYGWQPRQKLAEDLIIQAIRMNGMYIRYIPREVFERDPLFGEDSFVKFNYAFEIEVYVKSIDQYEGQQEIFSMFGNEIKDQITFTMARRRWKECNEEKIHDETGLPIESESSPQWTPYSTESLVNENGSEPDYIVASPFPKAGDLVYFPMVDKIFEIMFVEHENLFYAHGTLLTYDLKCELFRYNNEEFETGVSDIDAFNTLLGTDQADFAIQDEEGTDIESERSNETITEENNVVDEKDKQADNKFLQREAEDLISYDEKSPFLQKGKW